MAARRRYTFDYIAPNSGASVFMHGYTYRQAVAYSTTVYGFPAPGVLTPLGRVTKIELDTYRHVDGSLGRLVEVWNRAPFNPCRVEILELIEQF